jgi:hypothetical protein
MRAVKHLLAALLLALVVTGCMGDSDERRTAAIGEDEAETLSWRGEWTAEAEYQPGEVVTHDGATFVAVTPTAEAPDPRCETDCVWNVMAETGDATITETPAQAPHPKHDALWSRTGYDGPAELPQATQQAVEDWLAGVSRWGIRHQDDGGTVLGNNPVEAAGSYLVFARGVYVSAPGLGKEPIPQGSSPALGALVSGLGGFGKIVGSAFPRLGSGPLGALAKALSGQAVQEYTLTCALLADGNPIDDMSVTLSERGTATVSLMASSLAAADTKFSVGCAHNGKKAGPYVRDLYVLAFKYD